MARPSDEDLANRGVGDHLKEGLKNIKKTYKNLYNRDGLGGGGKTALTNVKIITTGKVSKSDVNQKFSPGTRAKLAVVGASSVTPLGPIVAVGLGIKKSVEEKKKAQQNLRNNPPPQQVPPTVTKTNVPTKPVGTTSVPPKTTGVTPPKTTNSFSSKTPLTPSKPGGTNTAPKLGQHKPPSNKK